MPTPLGQQPPGVDGANNNTAGTAFAQKYTASASATVVRVGVKIGAAPLPTITFAIYDDTGTEPGNRLTPATSLSSPVANASNLGTLASGLAITSGVAYWVAWLGTVNSFNYTNFAASGGSEKDIGSGALNNPWGASTGSNANIANVWAESDSGVVILGSQSIPFMSNSVI